MYVRTYRRGKIVQLCVHVHRGRAGRGPGGRRRSVSKPVLWCALVVEAEEEEAARSLDLHSPYLAWFPQTKAEADEVDVVRRQVVEYVAPLLWHPANQTNRVASSSDQPID